MIFQDNFYIDQSHRFDFDGGAVNFDHPDSIDFKLLTKVLERLGAGQEAEIPLYDFVTHRRKSECLKVRPKPMIIVDGILIFHWPEVRATFHERVFFETPESLRFQRRLERDTKERGRSPDGVRTQFERQVKPMHDQFVAPSASFASRIVREHDDFSDLLSEICRRFESA